MRLYKTLYEIFEELYVGYSAVAIILSSCLGSAAAIMILMNSHNMAQTFQLFLLMMVCMGYNSTVLAQLKPKFIFNAPLLSLAVSTIFLPPKWISFIFGLLLNRFT